MGQFKDLNIVALEGVVTLSMFTISNDFFLPMHLHVNSMTGYLSDLATPCLKAKWAIHKITYL